MSSQDTTTEYVAPYIRLPPGVTSNRDDITYFREGHTLVKHLDFIGKTPREIRGRYQKFILQRFMDEEELEEVLRDPGVEKVVQVTRETEVAAMKEDRALLTFPGSRPAPGYKVYFTTDTHKLEDHFATIGMKIEIDQVRTGGGYSVLTLPEPVESTLEKIFSDPKVWIIVQNTFIGIPEDAFRRPPSPSAYLAPYHLLPDAQTIVRGDMIFFREGHTLENHFEAIGKRPKYGVYQRSSLQRYMSEIDLEQVRLDPGVEKVIQVTREMEKAARKQDRSVVKKLGYSAAPGYRVVFTDGSYTLKEHFARIGQQFDNVTESSECGYYVDIPEAKLEKIFADPNVESIWQNADAELPEDKCSR